MRYVFPQASMARSFPSIGFAPSYFPERVGAAENFGSVRIAHLRDHCVAVLDVCSFHGYEHHVGVQSAYDEVRDVPSIRQRFTSPSSSSANRRPRASHAKPASHYALQSRTCRFEIEPFANVRGATSLAMCTCSSASVRSRASHRHGSTAERPL